MKLGASNQFFYYTQAGSNTFAIIFRLVWKTRIHQEVLQEAADEALRFYPELGAETVIKGNRSQAVRNDRPVMICPDDDRRYDFGSEAMNGHLFYFRIQDCSLRVPYYHGLSDVVGMLTYLIHVLSLYAVKTGESFTAEESQVIGRVIRKEVPGEEDMDCWDPYRLYGDADAKPDYLYPYPAAFQLRFSDQGSVSQTHIWHLRLSISRFLSLAKAQGVSAIPLLVDLISGSIRTAQKPGDEPVVAMVPVNMRPAFSSGTLVNFSDGIMIPYHEEDEEKSLAERCAGFKSYMNWQRTRENFQRTIHEKTVQVEQFENSGVPCEAILEQSVRMMASATTLPFTYALTYPGKLSFTPGIDALLEDAGIESVVPATGSGGVGAYSFGDELRLGIMALTEDASFAEGIRDAFRFAGLDAVLTPGGILKGDRLDLSKLRRM